MKKQIVFIMVDTQRADMLGCYGNEVMQTPNLDKLAEKGLRYTNAQTCQPVCGPARSTIFTGTFPHTNGMMTNALALGDNVKTIGQRLNDNGFNCGYIGKWHLDGSDYFGNGFCPDGWNDKYWYDMRTYLEELTDEQRLRSRKSRTSFDEDWTVDLTYAHRCSNRALNFLEEYGDEDFFLSVSYDEPHGPCICPAPYNTMYNGVSMPESENYGDNLETKTLMQRLWAGEDVDKDPKELHAPWDAMSLFLGCNSFVDMEIGRVLEKVYEKCPDAMVIYTADHGDMLKNHRLRSKNCSIYKEVLNIPLIIKGGAKGVVDHVASHVDLAPTIMDYMGLKIPNLLEGKSMMPQIKDGVTKINDAVFTEFTRYELDLDGACGFQPMRGIITEKYKLAINLLDNDELYDLEKDPAEIHNLINDESYSAIRNELHDKLIIHMDDTRDVFRGYQWQCRPWRKDKTPSFRIGGYARQRENEEYEPRQLDYDTGMPMESAVRTKIQGAERK